MPVWRNLRKPKQTNGTPQSSPPTWRAPATIIAILSLVVSLASFTVSFRSSQISSQALQLSSEEFFGSRLAILNGQLSEDNEGITLTPTDPNIHLQRADVYFPPQLIDSKWDVTPPKFSLALLVLRNKLQSEIEKAIPKKAGFAQAVPEFGIPLIIDSIYTTKGQVFQDRSLYVLTSFLVVYDEPFKQPSVDFKGLSFLERIGRDKKPNETLQAIWKQANFSTTPDKNP